MSTRSWKRATGDYKKGTKRSKRGTGGSKRAHLEVEKARLGGARVEKEIKTPRWQKPSKRPGHFDLENWCKYTYIFHFFPDLSISQKHARRLDGSSVYDILTGPKNHAKPSQKRRQKKHRKRAFPAQPAPRASGGGGLPRH